MLQTPTAPDDRGATGGSRLAKLCRVEPVCLTAVTSSGSSSWHGPSFTAVSGTPAIDSGTIKLWGGTAAQSPKAHSRIDDLLVQPGNVLVFMSSRLTVQPPQSVHSLLTQLRQLTGLNVTETADLLGVARRTVYGWTEKGLVSQENQGRLSAAVDALKPLADRWAPARIRQWLDRGNPSPRALLRRGAYADVRRAADDAAETGGIPLLEARHVVRPEDDRAPAWIGPLGPEDQRAYLAALTRPRPSRAVSAWTPPELTYSDPEPDE